MKTLTSHGKVELKGFSIGNYAEKVIDRITFTHGVIYNVEIIKGTEFSDEERTTENIRKEATKRGYVTPPLEVAVLLREAVSNEEIEKLGMWYIVTLHDPIKDADEPPRFLDVNRLGGGNWLNVDYPGPHDEWSDDGGFAFIRK